MIVKDEEDFLEQCLQSVKDYVDEIIIVDTGSTDNTKKIAARFTEKVFDYQWNNSFADARNFSLEQATGDWVLTLDADEKIAELDLKKIRETIERENDITGYVLIQRNYTDDVQRDNFHLREADSSAESKGFLGWSESPICRLFRNDNVRFEGEVHELIEPSIKKRGGTIKLLPIAIHHYKEKRSQERKKLKLLQYLKLCQIKIVNNPENARAHLEIATVLRVLGEYNEALQHFEKAQSIQPAFVEAALGAGICCNTLHRPQEAIQWLKKVLRVVPNHKEALISISVSYAKLNMLDEAIKNTTSAVELDKTNIKALINLAAFYEKSESLEEAEHILKKVLQIAPQQGRAHHNLGVVYEKMNFIEKAVHHYTIAVEQEPQNENWKKHLSTAKKIL